MSTEEIARMNAYHVARRTCMRGGMAVLNIKKEAVERLEHVAIKRLCAEHNRPYTITYADDGQSATLTVVTGDTRVRHISPLRKQVEAMEPGAELVLDLDLTSDPAAASRARVIASQVGFALMRRYSVSINRKAGKATITRKE